jgi:hypothetical protein
LEFQTVDLAAEQTSQRAMRHVAHMPTVNKYLERANFLLMTVNLLPLKVLAPDFMVTWSTDAPTWHG